MGEVSPHIVREPHQREELGPYTVQVGQDLYREEGDQGQITGYRTTSNRTQSSQAPAIECGVHKYQRQNAGFTSTSNRMRGSQEPAIEHGAHKYQRQNAEFTSTSDRTQGS